MKCPRCENIVLDERDRDGIVVDACAKCRGIWLDRGELEKLIARATEELDASAHRSEPPRDRDRRYDSDRDRDHGREHRDYGREHRDYGREHGRRPKRKRSFLESLGDVFD